MICEKCGANIDSVLVDVFQRDGSDTDIKHSLFEEEESCVCIETTQNWTGYELSEEEMRGTIVCPHCKQFPFINTEIQVYDIVRVVCFKREG